MCAVAAAGDVGPLKADALAAVWQQQPKLVTAGLEWIIRNSCSEVEPYRSALIPEDAAISVAGGGHSIQLSPAAHLQYTIPELHSHGCGVLIGSVMAFRVAASTRLSVSVVLIPH